MNDDGESTAPVDEAAVRDRLVAAHGDALDAVAAAADTVWAAADGPVTDGGALAATLERRLDAAGVHADLPGVLATAVEAAGLSLAARPVAAPPYVTVTSRGPVLRGSVADGRLVVTLGVFAVERGPTRYVRAPGAGETTVEVAFER